MRHAERQERILSSVDAIEVAEGVAQPFDPSEPLWTTTPRAVAHGDAIDRDVLTAQMQRARHPSMLVVVTRPDEGWRTVAMRNRGCQTFKAEVGGEVGLVAELVFQVVDHPGLNDLDTDAGRKRDVGDVERFRQALMVLVAEPRQFPRERRRRVVDECPAGNRAEVRAHLDVQPAADRTLRNVERKPDRLGPIEGGVAHRMDRVIGCGPAQVLLDPE